jgi:hypothetical protein
MHKLLQGWHRQAMTVLAWQLDTWWLDTWRHLHCLIQHWSLPLIDGLVDARAILPVLLLLLLLKHTPKLSKILPQPKRIQVDKRLHSHDAVSSDSKQVLSK